jgi:CRP-like cAMP-binding protein
LLVFVLRLLQSLPVDAANRLVATMTVRSFSDRDLVFSAGDKGHLMYVIISGAVRVYVGSTGSDSDAALEIARLCEMGQSFGELALYSNHPRSATCIADGKLETFVLEKDCFLQFCPPRIISDVTSFSSKSAEKLCQALSEPVRKRSAVAEAVIVSFLRRVKFFENLQFSTIALLSQANNH